MRLKRKTRSISQRIRTDPDTGLKYKEQESHWEFLCPEPPPLKEYATPLDNFIRKTQKTVIAGWDDPRMPGHFDIAKGTLPAARRLGFLGHISNWANNVLAGCLVEDGPDRTPQKIKDRNAETI